ncbi:MAG: bifunctional tRNA (5-methylaminomethyl-2-thiouridine)(34)-methyltransferase MnmD/FAD-dependent 5-carboxymethylaminomethyl-2-thiouridine(34) oxidoreductase MnmC [Pseudomonadota bacterium]
MVKDDRIKTANVDWGAADKDQLAPRSIFFDDIYFSGDGLAETNHVFLRGNGLPDRFRDAHRFTIGELGFGTGLNFLAAWDCWRKAKKPDNARLDFFSVEAFPLAPADLTRAHTVWPSLSRLSQRLTEALPPPHPGFHQIDIDQNVTLTLFFGDVLDGLSKAEGAINAWFLDGFSPAKNPGMWGEDVMREIARLSADKASMATFTVAGGVRRAVTAAGFEVEKQPGHGRKREMLAGQLATRPLPPSIRKPWFASDKSLRLQRGARLAIIGAGIAGASLAYTLSREGFSPVVYEAAAPASGASGNPAGLIMPRLDVGDSATGRFHASAYLYTVQLLNRLQEQSAGTLFDSCGVVLHAAKEEEKSRQEKLLMRQALPKDWITAHEDGLLFPQGGVVHPPSFVNALLDKTPVRKATVNRLRHANGAWRVESADNASDTFDAVVIANGLDALRFEQARTLPLNGSAGQIDWLPEAKAPDHARAFGPYAARAPAGGVVIGATYAPIAIGAEAAFTQEATQTNIKAVAAVLPDLADAFEPKASHPRASIRCVTPDRMPIAGPMPNWGFYGGAYDKLRQGRRQDYPHGQMQPGLFILSGLGSRGLVTAPLAAAMIAREMAGAMSPVEIEVAEALHPARFFIRDLKRAVTVRP